MNDTPKPERDNRGNQDRRRRSGDAPPRKHHRDSRHSDGQPRRQKSDRRREGQGRPQRDRDDRQQRYSDERPRRDGEQQRKRRDQDQRPRRDGERRPRRDDHGRDRERSFAPRERKYRGGHGRERSYAETDGHDFRPVRAAHTDPEIPEGITEKDLHPSARNELKTLDKDFAAAVAKHLAAVAHFIDDDPSLAHQHAISAMRKASRIPVTRETYAITSYLTGDYVTALRELRTYRRLTGREDHLPLMIDAERAMGRPEKGIETGREVDTSKLSTEVRVQAAIAMSGARLDLGQTLQALYELEIPELNPNRAYSWSPELFAAYANVLEDLHRTEESQTWRRRAFAAEAVLHEHYTGGAMEIIEIEETEPETDEHGASTSKDDA